MQGGRLLPCVEGHFALLSFQFVLMQGPDSLPEPDDTSVTLRTLPGGIYAARSFPGMADDTAAQQQLQQLRDCMQRDGLQAKSSKDWLLARYNDPSTKPMFRRNDVLVELAIFDIWEA